MYHAFLLKHIFFNDRKYVPKLRKFPAQYIYEPWKAPKSVQAAAGCIIGQDYPKPVVDHDTISKVNIKRMAAAYAKRKEGQDFSGRLKTFEIIGNVFKSDTDSLCLSE